MPDNGLAVGRDLWGAAFSDDLVESAPLALLKEQANALTQRTGGCVVGEVLDDKQDATIWTSLYARVPALRDYRHKLISIAHPLVVADPANPFPLTVFDTQSGEQAKVGKMDEFVGWLERTLSSSEIHNVINNLMRYGRDRAAS